MHAARSSILPVTSSALSVVRRIHCQSRQLAVHSDLGGTGRESSIQVTNSRYLLLHRSCSSHTTNHATSWRASSSKALIPR